MKRIIFTAFLLFGTTAGFAQLHFDIRAGAAAASFGEEHLKIGFRAGANAEYLFDGRFGIRTGLFYTVKGATTSSNPFNYKAGKATRLSYIDLPVEFAAQFRVAPRSSLALHAGPYVACLVDSAQPAADIRSFHRWDAGVGIGLDFITGHFIVGPDVQYGLTRLTSPGTDHNVTYSLTLGYRF